MGTFICFVEHCGRVGYWSSFCNHLSCPKMITSSTITPSKCKRVEVEMATVDPPTPIPNDDIRVFHCLGFTSDVPPKTLDPLQ